MTGFATLKIAELLNAGITPLVQGDGFYHGEGDLPQHLTIKAERLATLRYGENAHQRAAIYSRVGGHGIVTVRTAAPCWRAGSASR